MWKILVRTFALFGFLIAIALSAGVYVLLSSRSPTIPEADELILSINLNDEFPEQSTVPGGIRHFFNYDQLEFTRLITTIEKAKHDKRVKGIVLFLDTVNMGFAQLEELRNSLKRFKDKGKTIWAYGFDASNFAQGRSQFYIGSVAHSIALQPFSGVGLEGITYEQPFLGQLLESLDIEAQFLKRRKYKTAADMYTEKEFTKENAESLSLLFERIYDHQMRAIAAGREINYGNLKKIATENLVIMDREAQQFGLVDEIVSFSEWDNVLRKKYCLEDSLLPCKDGKKCSIWQRLFKIKPQEPKTQQKKCQVIPVTVYAKIAPSPHQQNKDSAPAKRVAVINASGPIIDDESDEGFMNRANHTISGRSMIALLKSVEHDDEIDALIIRLDTPGGSAVGSEMVRAAIEEVRKSKKKVFVSFGNMAASGGYWIATACDRIFASESTITGSIGVIFGKVSFSQLLRNYGIHVDSVKVGGNGALGSNLTPFTDAQLAQLSKSLDYTYEAFKRLVQEGRHLDAETVEEIAQGRVWSGLDGMTLGLVDEIGGFYETVKAMRKELGVAEEDYILLVPVDADPESMGFLNFFKRHVISTVKAAQSFGASLNQFLGLTQRPSIQLAAPELAGYAGGS